MIDETDKYDILNIPDGFSYFAKNRKIFKHTSGGIVVCIYRNNLKNQVSRLKRIFTISYVNISMFFLST
jgi:hypothetical protein